MQSNWFSKRAAQISQQNWCTSYTNILMSLFKQIPKRVRDFILEDTVFFFFFWKNYDLLARVHQANLFHYIKWAEAWSTRDGSGINHTPTNLSCCCAHCRMLGGWGVGFCVLPPQYEAINNFRKSYFSFVSAHLLCVCCGYVTASAPHTHINQI